MNRLALMTGMVLHVPMYNYAHTARNSVTILSYDVEIASWNLDIL